MVESKERKWCGWKRVGCMQVQYFSYKVTLLISDDSNKKDICRNGETTGPTYTIQDCSRAQSDTSNPILYYSIMHKRERLTLRTTYCCKQPTVPPNLPPTHLPLTVNDQGGPFTGHIPTLTPMQSYFGMTNQLGFSAFHTLLTNQHMKSCEWMNHTLMHIIVCVWILHVQGNESRGGEALGKLLA